MHVRQRRPVHGASLHTDWDAVAYLEMSVLLSLHNILLPLYTIVGLIDFDGRFIQIKFRLT